jgi:hypothetical protein
LTINISDKGGNLKPAVAQGEQKKQDQRRMSGQHQHKYQQRRIEYKKKDPEEILVLWYGPANNFSKFKKAMFKAAFKNYGNLGQLIQLEGRYYQPTCPDRNYYNLSNDPSELNQMEYLEDRVKCSNDWDTIKQETDPAMLWDIIESMHKINTISKVKSVMKMAARTTYQQIRQGTYENIITYKKRFNNALKAYIDQKNPVLDDKDVTMDFFQGLDNAIYAGFNTKILSRLTSKAIKQPENLNTMYLLANQWVKPVMRGNAAGFASTFTTTLDHTVWPHGNQQRGKRRGEGKKKGNEQQQQAGGGGTPKENNDRKAQVECFTCGELGHYANKVKRRELGARTVLHP